MVFLRMPYSQFQSPPVEAAVPATSIAQGTTGNVESAVPVLVFHIREFPMVIALAVAFPSDSPNSEADSVPIR